MNNLYLILLFISTTIYGQSKDSDSLKVKMNASLSASITDGVEFQRSFQFEFNPTIEKGFWSLQNEFRFLYGDADDLVVNRNWDALILFKVYLDQLKRWYPFTVLDFQTNLKFELEYRLGIGGGLTHKSTFKNIDKLLLSFGTVYYQNRYTGSNFDNSDEVGNQRNMLRLILHYNIKTQIVKDKITLKSDGWFLQSTRERSDYIIKLSLGVELSVSEVVSVTLDYRYNYENVTLENIDNNQQFTSIGLKADFN
ncbi:MAG: DUF481 domain-containing protein [Bacteroidota bacterium]